MPTTKKTVANDVHELQYLELDHCIDLLHICDVWKDCLRIGLPVRWNVIGVCTCHWGSKHIHSNKKLTMQGLKVNAFSSVSVIGREHF